MFGTKSIWGGVLALVAFLVACGGRDRQPVGAAEGGFVDRAEPAGLVHVNHTGVFQSKPTIVEAKGGGVLTLDYDGDGLLDLYFVDGNSFLLDTEGKVVTKCANPDSKSRLYRNLGGLRFSEVTDEAAVGKQSFGLTGTVGDYDNDGDPDIYVCNWGRNFLYRNDGNGKFSEVAEAAGVAGADDEVSMAAVFFDADADGDLDLYVSNAWDLEAEFLAAKGKFPGVIRDGLWIYGGPYCYKARADVLYRNDGDGTFTGDPAALRNQKPSYGMQPVPFDADDDGDSDLYVPNDSVANFLWINDGTGHFDDRAVVAGAAYDTNGAPQAGMGVAAADFDADGRVDLLVTNFSNEYATLYRNLTVGGEVRFQDVSASARIESPTWDRLSWGVGLRDFDLDGVLDIFIASGGVYPTRHRNQRLCCGTYEESSLFLLGDGAPKWTFTDATAVSGTGLAIARLGRSATFADLDEDGDLDAVVACLNARPMLLENRLPRRGHYLGVRLTGTRGNRDGIGARVTVSCAGGKVRQTFDHTLGGSFGAALDPREFFGLGPADQVDLLKVRWPSGLTSEFRDVPVDRIVGVVEGETELLEVKPPAATTRSSR